MASCLHPGGSKGMFICISGNNPPARAPIISNPGFVDVRSLTKLENNKDENNKDTHNNRREIRPLDAAISRVDWISAEYCGSTGMFIWISGDNPSARVRVISFPGHVDVRSLTKHDWLCTICTSRLDSSAVLLAASVETSVQPGLLAVQHRRL